MCSRLIFLVFLVPALLCAATTPDRAHGISMHMLPKRVADIGGRPWGLTVDFASYLKPESAPPVIQNTSQFLSYVRKQDEAVQQNGVWIVTTHPDAYSEPEKEFLEGVKALCKREYIALFIARASELPNGWKQY